MDKLTQLDCFYAAGAVLGLGDTVYCDAVEVLTASGPAAVSTDSHQVSFGGFDISTPAGAVGYVGFLVRRYGLPCTARDFLARRATIGELRRAVKAAE